MATNNNSAKDAIKAYLDKRAAEDELFAQSYAKPKKNIDECLRYILGEAHKQGDAVCMTDEEVFGLAVHYYDEDDVKIEKLPAGTIAKAKASAPAVELTNEEKEAAKRTAIANYEREVVEQHKAKQAELARKRREAKKQEQEHQPSLFDMMSV